MNFTGGNKCPMCGKEYFATPPLEPNIKEKEFYGGRVKFFKDVLCDCEAKYRLCIERRFNSREAKDELRVIDMIIQREGYPKEEVERMARQRREQEIQAATNEIVKEQFTDGTAPTFKQRENIRKEVVLANILDLDTKIEALSYHTVAELQSMCKTRRIKFPKKANKTELAKLLLAEYPELVSED